jgi:hypothetical protein
MHPLMYRLWFFFIVVMTLFSCNNPRKGALSPQVRTEIQQLAISNEPIPHKYEVLARRMETLLREASAKKKDEELIEHLRVFYAENSLALDRLEAEFQTWFRETDPEELNQFLMELNQQQYITDLRIRRRDIRSRLLYNKPFLAEFERLTRCLEFRK